MDDSRETERGNGSSSTWEQLSLGWPQMEKSSEWEIGISEAELPFEVQHRVKVIQQLMVARGTAHYAKVQQQAARSLGVSVRSLRRLVKTWQEQGISGLSRQMRSDQGKVKTSREWQDFIVKTYREGNRGSRRMSPAQVAIRVKVQAQELGIQEKPSRSTVYRILQPHLEKRQRQKRSRLMARGLLNTQDPRGMGNSD